MVHFFLLLKRSWLALALDAKHPTSIMVTFLYIPIFENLQIKIFLYRFLKVYLPPQSTWPRSAIAKYQSSVAPYPQFARNQKKSFAYTLKDRDFQ